MKAPFILMYAILIMACLVSVAQATTAPVVADTYIDSTQSTQSFGLALSVKVKNTAKALLGFELKALPSGVTVKDINKATLFIYVKDVLAIGKLQVKQVNNAWTETGMTNNNAPFLGIPVASSATVSQKGTYFTVDVTPLVKNWVTTPASNYGLVLEPDASTPTTSIIFDSKEETSTSHPAYLDIALNNSAVHTSAVCSGGEGLYNSYRNGDCSCAVKTISKTWTYGKCTVSSDTGSCSASVSGYIGDARASCCVCSP